MNIRRKIMMVLTMVLTLALVGVAYGYWGGLINGSSANDSETITVGTGHGEAVTTVVELTKTVVGGELVPSGRVVATERQVEKVVLTFDVLWTDKNKASHGAVGKLTIEPVFDNNPKNLLNVDVAGDGAITAGTTQTITLTITLTEPADVAEYELVAGKEFTLTITFSVEVQK